MKKNDIYAVTGAGGAIGGHLVKYFESQGIPVIASDIKPLHDWYQVPQNEESTTFVGDLRLFDHAAQAVRGATRVYNLAADMGGMGFLFNHRLSCRLSVLISTHVLLAAQEVGVDRFFYSSSACVYPEYRQEDTLVQPLKESDAWPAQPEPSYGDEKLFSEGMCKDFYNEYGLETRVARFHNVYATNGTYDGGREKAPSAICRKVIQAKLSGKHEIDIWGDGEQTRTYMHIDDCIKGINLITDSDYREPLNLGSDELVSVNELVSIVEEIAGIKLERHYDLSQPQGVRGRSSDNTLIKSLFDWEPSIKLREGMVELYEWIYKAMTQ